MSNRLRVQRRTSTSASVLHDDSRLDANEVQPATSPAPATTSVPGHDFATLDLASPDQSASLSGPEVQRTHLRIQPGEPRFEPGAGRAVQRSTDDLGQRIRAAQDGGSSLEPTVQQRLESGLGADLSGVRVHTDGEADQLSHSVSATAFTTGSHIFFRSGVYSPHSTGGMQLLAHEAAHTVQQARGPVSGTPAPGGVSISDPSDRFEQAAETAAQRMVSEHSESRDMEESSGGGSTTGPVQVQRIPEWLKFWKKPPPPPPKPPAKEISPLPEEARVQDSESEDVAPASPAPAAKDAEKAYDQYIPAPAPAPGAGYAPVPEAEAPALGARYLGYASMPPAEAPAPGAGYAAVPEAEAPAPGAGYAPVPEAEVPAPGAGYAPVPEAEAPAVEAVTPPPASASVGGAKRTFKVASSPSLPPSAPAAEAPGPELSPFAKELAERARTKQFGISASVGGRSYPYRGERYANLRHNAHFLRDARKPASLPPDVAQEPRYQTKELGARFRGDQEKLAKEKWVRGKYVGQTGFIYGLREKQAVKYMAEEERAQYEIRRNKDDNLFYWEKTGQVFNTTKMTSVGGQSKAKGRALFVMTESGKIYAANEGYEFRKGMGEGPPGPRRQTYNMDPEERWRLNHSSFLWGEPVAAAGELIFEKGVLKGITDISGHYHPQIEHMRQVVQEFAAQGVDVSGVWVLLTEKSGAKGDWYVPAKALVDNPGYSEADFRDPKNNIGSPTV